MAEKVFYAVVTQFDCDPQSKWVSSDNPPRGPLLLERYLNNEHAQSQELTQKDAERFRHNYGWTRVAKVIVDIPEGE